MLGKGWLLLANNVLEELRVLGVLGSGSLLSLRGASSESEQVEKIDSSRKARTMAILDELLDRVDGFRSEIQELRALWADEVQEAVSEEGPQVAAQDSVSANVDADATVSVKPSYEEVLARALRKIRGEESSSKTGSIPDEDAPYVGHVRSISDQGLDEEVTLGTIGTIKPSFPEREN